MDFDRNVFINCPFDQEYYSLMKTLLFSVKRLGFIPRFASERSDSGEVRLNKIKDLIESSKYSIHDLSRTKSKKIGEYFRQNMPFELGLDLGCRDYKEEKKYRSKSILILEEERYSVQKALSDMSFADCKCHEGKEEEIVYSVRNWFAENGLENAPSASSIWDDYNYFYANIYEKKINGGFKSKDIDRLPISELMSLMDEEIMKS